MACTSTSRRATSTSRSPSRSPWRRSTTRSAGDGGPRARERMPGMGTRIDPRALTRELLAFNTINPPGQERACAHRLGAILEEVGYAVEYHEFANTRTSLIARIGGSAEKPPICFTGHIDTVPLGAAKWTRDPFAGETDGDRLF